MESAWVFLVSPRSASGNGTPWRHCGSFARPLYPCLAAMFTATMDTAPSQRTRIGAVADDRAKVSAITRSVAWIKPKPTLIGTLRREPLYSCSSFTDRTSDDYPA